MEQSSPLSSYFRQNALNKRHLAEAKYAKDPLDADVSISDLAVPYMFLISFFLFLFLRFLLPANRICFSSPRDFFSLSSHMLFVLYCFSEISFRLIPFLSRI